METKSSKFLQTVKKIKSPDFIYLSILFVFLIIVIALFIFSTNFIVENINKIFSPPSDGNTEVLDLKNYTLVSKRLNLPVDAATPEVITNAVALGQTLSADATSTANAPTMKSITINVLNSTSKSGAATTLAKELENAGFSKATTGNQKKLYPITTILIKDSKKAFSDTLKNLTRKTYPKTITTNASETATFDVTIIIGAQ